MSSAAPAGTVHALAACLCAGQLIEHDDYLDAAATQALAASAQRRFERGEFAAARIGPEGRALRCPEVRGDEICWLGEARTPAERDVLERFEELRLACNREALLGLFDVELQYARYAAGAAYARHVDQPAGRAERKISLILYLNAAWTAADGGELRQFDGAGAHRDIAPLGGRLVGFASEGREHEVLPARRTRWSLSGWLRTRG
jgi:SM-20-related protein